MARRVNADRLEAPELSGGATREERIEYLTGLALKRGYVLPQYGVLAGHDLPTLKVIDQVTSSIYLQDRELSRAVKEIIFIITFSIQKMPIHGIANHVKMAIEHGMTPQQVLEAIEMLLPHTGIPTFSHALEAWTLAMNAEQLEVDLPVYEGGLLRERPSASTPPVGQVDE